MYSYNLKFTIESEKNPLWRDEVKTLFYKGFHEKDGLFDDVLRRNAKKFIQAYYPLQIVHLVEIESLDVVSDLG